MKYVDVIRYCQSLPHTSKQEYSSDGTAFSFNVGEHPFAWFETGAPIQWKFSIQVTPDLFDQLHSPPKVVQVDKPGGQWLKITRIETFDEPQVKAWIDWSYQWSYQQSLKQASSVPS